MTVAARLVATTPRLKALKKDATPKDDGDSDRGLDGGLAAFSDTDPASDDRPKQKGKKQRGIMGGFFDSRTPGLDAELAAHRMRARSASVESEGEGGRAGGGAGGASRGGGDGDRGGAFDDTIDDALGDEGGQRLEPAWGWAA